MATVIHCFIVHELRGYLCVICEGYGGMSMCLIVLRRTIKNPLSLATCGFLCFFESC